MFTVHIPGFGCLLVLSHFVYTSVLPIRERSAVGPGFGCICIWHVSAVGLSGLFGIPHPVTRAEEMGVQWTCFCSSYFELGLGFGEAGVQR